MAEENTNGEGAAEGAGAADAGVAVAAPPKEKAVELAVEPKRKG